MRTVPGMFGALALMFAVALHAQEFGSITFPTSGKAAAQPAFLTGVKALHNFQFDEAAAAFKEAQRLDKGFALAYWGEAMSHNHPLWSQQDLDAAKAALGKLAPTHEARLALAPLPKEKALLEAMQQLYFAPGEKKDRDQAYSAAMAGLYEKWPDDHEIGIFYALSLLGTIQSEDRSFRRQALAASIAQRVVETNPRHPGAVHFIIHAFDDPDHAPLALPAARVYAKIAPDAAHALHMPSHIFVQRGMWQDVIDSNTVAYKAAVELNKRMKLPEGREDFHTLAWLMYGNLMLARFDEAASQVRLASEAYERNPDNWGVRDGYGSIRARYILETGRWEKIALAPAGESAPAASHGSASGMTCAMATESGSGTWTFITGVSAAKSGDLDTAQAVVTRLREMTASAKEVPLKKSLEIQEKQVAAFISAARGNKEESIQLAKAAADIELTTQSPSGPPYPIKPAFELYGELLLQAGRPKEALAAFEQALLRTPNRAPAVKGVERAKASIGKHATAQLR